MACERSGVVRDAFRRRGHDAWSCDLVDSAADGPHMRCDAREAVARGWDLVIAHPDCTYLCNSGVWCLGRDAGRWGRMRVAVEFLNFFLRIKSARVCVENPVPHCYARAWMDRDYDQTIQPWQFGEPESKRTCLWLQNLPALRPTNVLIRPECGHWDNQTASGQNRLSPGAGRAMERARTYLGIAEAMADQWGE